MTEKQADEGTIIKTGTKWKRYLRTISDTLMILRDCNQNFTHWRYSKEIIRRASQLANIDY